MTAPTLNAIAIDVVGHYASAAKNLLAAYRKGSERAFPKLDASRLSDGAERLIDRLADGTVKGIKGFAQRTEWADGMFVVGAARRVNLPAAKLSLEIASRVDEATQALSTRASEEKAPAKSARKPVARRTRRTRRAA